MPASLEPFSGEELFNATPKKAFAVLTDLEALPSAMPGVASSQRLDERTLKATVRPGFSFVGGQIRLTLHLVEASAPASAVMRVEAQGIGMSMQVESRLVLSPLDDGRRTRLAWVARVSEIKGLITAVPAGLIRAAAEKTISDGWNRLRARIEEEAV